MSLFVRGRSSAYRLRDHGAVVAEAHGPLHRPEVLLEWGSITKTVTAAITYRLADLSAISLAAPVTRYLPNADLPDLVTVASLVEHTSGLPRVPSDMFSEPGDLVDPYARYTNEHFDDNVLTTLGSKHDGSIGKYSYSNLGYAVLTRLLELTTERTWWDLAQEHVLIPFDVADVTVQPDQTSFPVLRSWTGKPRGQWSNVGPFVGAGGLVGTFDALEQYVRATAQHVASGGGTPGWQRSSGLWWHNGHTRDHGSFVGFNDEHVITVHTLGHRSGTADRIATRVMRQSPGRRA